MAFGSAESQIRQQQFVQALQNRKQYSDFLGETDLAKQAYNPQYFAGRAEGVFSSQAQNIAGETRLRLDQALTGLQGLGSGIAEKNRASIGASQVGRVASVRSSVSQAAAAQQTQAEAQYHGMLTRLGEIDTSILEMEREFATRAFDEGLDPSITANFEGSDLQLALDFYKDIAYNLPQYTPLQEEIDRNAGSVVWMNNRTLGQNYAPALEDQSGSVYHQDPEDSDCYISVGGKRICP
jgi:hypothetical protein